SGVGTMGGFAGVTFVGTISQSYSSGNVNAANGSQNVGGFVGLEDAVPGPGNTITNSYSVSNIFTSNSSGVGGFVGILDNINGGTPIVSNSYSSGSITGSGNTNVGGFSGTRIAGTVTNSFWDTQSSGQASATGSGVATGITGQTTAQMETLATFTGA